MKMSPWQIVSALAALVMAFSVIMGVVVQWGSMRNEVEYLRSEYDYLWDVYIPRLEDKLDYIEGRLDE